MTVALRRENAHLRNSNSLLVADNLRANYKLREATVRIQALLATIPPADGSEADAPAAVEADAVAQPAPEETR